MSAAVLAADTPGSPGVNITIFALFVAITLLIVFRASRNNRTAADYYAGGRSFTGPQNGIAISGDYLSAASFLGIAGAIAINGYDGFLYSIGFLVAWLVALLLVAELLRNTGKYTMGDVLAFRMQQGPVRAAAATSTLIVSLSSVGDDGLKVLGSLPRLRTLQARSTKVTDAGLAHLQDLVGLEVLVLGGNDITDAGVARLANIKGLMGLFLNSTKVTDAGLDHLRGMGKMTKLNLSKTAVTDAGVEKLKKALPLYATVIRDKAP